MATSISSLTVLQASGVPEYNGSINWQIWREQLEIHFNEIKCEDEKAKKSTLLKSLGSETYSVLRSICHPELPASKAFAELCTILENHFTPPTIVFRERKIFHSAKKEDDETINQWFARIKKLALLCKFGDHLDAMILDQFIIGLPSKMFERLCEEDETISIQSALRKALIMESKLTDETSYQTNVNFIKHKSNNKNFNKQNKSNGISKSVSKGDRGEECSASKQSNSGRDNSSSGSKNRTQCKHCGWKNHSSNNCKYKESRCHSCKQIGHLASVCKYKKSVNSIDNSDVNELSDNIFNFSVFSLHSKFNSDVYSLRVVVDGVGLVAACDTGAPCVLVPYSFYSKNYGNRPLEKCKTPYVNYSGDRIPIIGEYVAVIDYKNVSKRINVIVTETDSPPLLGRTFLRAFEFDLVPKMSLQDNGNENNEVCSVNYGNLNLIIDQLKSEFALVFENSLGTYKDEVISLDLVENSTPVFHKARPIPLAWKSKVEEKLQDMVKNGVIEQINNSAWGTPLVPVLKPNGDLRICGDYKVTLNKYLCDFKYPLPRIDEIFVSLQGGEVYTKLDLSNAYNQLVLDEKSQMLCAVSTHIGVFKVKRLPFGIKVASAIFQKTIENLLKGIPNVVVYQDDITVTGKDFSSHMQNLKSVLSKLRNAGLKLNYSKCQFFKNEINYLGFCINKNGLKKNNDRVSSIINAPIPTCIPELRAFIGLSNYYSKFIENYADKMEPLYHLLRKDSKFVWTHACQEAYECIKRDITSDLVLTHFNPSLPIILTTDASADAVSGVLSHKIDRSLKPIAFVSRSLSKSEKGYSTLEKEALGIVFSVSKFKQYLLGNKFILKTDHRPLTTIFGENKSLPVMASARIQRWAVILSAFDYSIEYIKGIENYADGLSRMPQFAVSNDSNECNYINLIEAKNEIGLNFKDISRTTGRDPILSIVKEAVLNGTLGNLQENKFAPYTNKINELHVEYDVLLWGHRVIVPEKLRYKLLQQLHISHLGIVKTKGLARSYIWWPGIDNEIEKLIKSCKFCQESLSSPERSSLIPWHPTESVWSRIHLDYAGPINGYYILVVIDSFSKFVEVFQTKTITSHFTEMRVRELFCRYGLVDTVVTDNGRQFTAETFRNFLKVNGVRHVLTAPGHPATNGQAENFVKTIKKSLIASFKDNPGVEFETILNRFLIDYRNSKHCTTGESPAKLFFGRSLKTRFSLLKPPTAKEIIIESQRKSISNYKGKRDKTFSKGETVIIRDYKNPNKPSWAHAKIKSQIGPRSYTCIFTHNNREIKRHLDQIRNAGSEDDTNTHELVNSEQQLQSTTVPIRKLRPRKEGKVIKVDDID